MLARSQARGVSGVARGCAGAAKAATHFRLLSSAISTTKVANIQQHFEKTRASILHMLAGLVMRR